MTVSAQLYLGRFTLQRLRASGSFATLYQAWDEWREKQVALKLFSHSFEPDALSKSGLEPLNKRLAALNHPNILPVTETSGGDASWAVSEFMTGGSLKDRLAEPMDPEGVAKVLVQVAAALDAAHAIGIVHGDIKPSNVLVDAAGNYRVSDFGMAAMARQAPQIIRLYSATPAPAYMSPEQASDLPLTPRSDEYSLGVLAYQLLTGAVPYSGPDGITVAGKQAKTSPETPSDLNPLVSRALDDCVLTALARDPVDRYSSAGAFAEAFRAALGQGITQRAPEIAQATQAGAPAPQQLTVLCWNCGHVNLAGHPLCELCWLPLDPTKMVAAQAQLAVSKKPRLGDLARTSIVLCLALVTFLVASTYFPRPLPPRATTNVSSPTGPGLWTSDQADARSTGTVPGPAPTFTGAVKWQLFMPAGVIAEPVVTRDAVYLATGDARVLALDPATGAILWQRPVLGPVNATPAVAGDLLYVGLRGGDVLALDLKTGEERWTFDSGGNIFGGVKVHNGALYVGTGGGAIVAADARTGKLLWKYNTYEYINAVPSFTDDGLLVVPTEQGTVYVLDAVTGEFKLRSKLARPVTNPAVVIGHVAYVAKADGAITAVNLRDRSRSWDELAYWSGLQAFVFNLTSKPPVQRGILWTDQLAFRSLGGVSVLGNTAFISEEAKKQDGGGLFAVDLGKQSTLWTFPLRGSLTPTIVGDTVYAASKDGKVDAIGAADGASHLEWRLPAGMEPTTSPIPGGNSLFIGANLSVQSLTIDRRDAQGNLLPDQADDAQGSWYYHYPGTYCSPQGTGNVGPFDTQQDALREGYGHTPGCGGFFALG